MGLGLFSYFKDSTAQPNSFAEYERKLKKIIGCYTFMDSTPNAWGRTLNYKFNVDEKNLIILISFLERILREKGYPTECLVEVSNPNLLKNRINKAFHAYVNDDNSVFNNDYVFLRTPVRDYWKNYISPIYLGKTTINEAFLEEMYEKFKEIWDIL